MDLGFKLSVLLSGLEMGVRTGWVVYALTIEVKWWKFGGRCLFIRKIDLFRNYFIIDVLFFCINTATIIFYVFSVDVRQKLYCLFGQRQ